MARFNIYQGGFYEGMCRKHWDKRAASGPIFGIRRFTPGFAMRIFAIFTSVIAAYWWTVGIWASNASPSLYCISFIVSALIIVAAFRRERPTAVSPEERRRLWHVFGIVTGLEGVAILAAFVFLPAMRATDFSASVQAIIVGAHFILLARLIPARLYYVTGHFWSALVLPALRLAAPTRTYNTCAWAEPPPFGYRTV